jgi:hypothetical protein
MKTVKQKQEHQQQQKTIKLTVGVDMGNNALKVSYRVGSAGPIQVYNPAQKNEFNRLSTMFVGFDLKTQSLEAAINDEVVESNGCKFVEVDPSDLDVYFNFFDNLDKDPSYIFRCIKSQYYEGAFSKNSEFFSKVAEKIGSDGSLFRYFYLGKHKDVHVLINTNLFFQKLFVVVIKEILKVSGVDFFAEDKALLGAEKLSIQVVSSVPLGIPNQLFNEDEQIQSYLDLEFLTTVFKMDRTIDREPFFRYLEKVPVENSEVIIREFETTVKFKTVYEVAPIIYKSLKNNEDDKLLLFTMDHGSMTKQFLGACILKKRKSITPFIVKSEREGGMQLNEEIIVRYCYQQTIDPRIYFWGNTKSCYRNLETIEGLKKTTLFKEDFHRDGVVLYGRVPEENHVLDFECFRMAVLMKFIQSINLPQEYKRFVKKEVERFIEHEGGNVLVKLLGESFNQHTRMSKYNGVSKMLNGLGLNLLKREPGNIQHMGDVNYVSKVLVEGFGSENNPVMDYTLYDNLVVSSFSENFNLFLLLCPGQVGLKKEFFVTPIKIGNVEYIYVFTYVLKNRNRLNLNHFDSSVYEKLTKKMITTDTKVNIFDDNNLGMLKRNKNFKLSFEKSVSPYYLLPLFKFAFNRDGGVGGRVKMTFDFINTFETVVEVSDLEGGLIFKQLMKYPLVLDRFDNEMFKYDFFRKSENGKFELTYEDEEYESKMFCAFYYNVGFLEKDFLRKKDYAFVLPKDHQGLNLDFGGDEDEDDGQDVQMLEKNKQIIDVGAVVEDEDDDDVEMKEKEDEKPKRRRRKKKKKKKKKKNNKNKKGGGKKKKKKKKKKRRKKRKREEEEADDAGYSGASNDEVEEIKPKRKKRKKRKNVNYRDDDSDFDDVGTESESSLTGGGGQDQEEEEDTDFVVPTTPSPDTTEEFIDDVDSLFDVDVGYEDDDNEEKENGVDNKPKTPSPYADGQETKDSDVEMQDKDLTGTELDVILANNRPLSDEELERLSGESGNNSPADEVELRPLGKAKETETDPDPPTFSTFINMNHPYTEISPVGEVSNVMEEESDDEDENEDEG